MEPDNISPSTYGIEKWELQKERYKLQTEKLEFNKWLRENARDELFMEKIIEAIKANRESLPPIHPIEIKRGKKCGVLSIADCHFAKDFTIYGLNNEILNQYSPEIFYQRMDILFSETLEIIKRENLSYISVYSLGDVLDGFLRHSQLWTLRYGVVDSAIIFGRYMGRWLRELSNHVVVEYHQTNGNHTELRLLDGRKGAHLNENIEKIVADYIDLINEDNPNFSIVYNKTGFIFDNLAGFNILGIHGEVKDLQIAIKDYSDIYDVKIDYLFAGHKHHAMFNNCGVRRGVVGVGSIVGSDDLSIKIRKQADASASFVIFEEGKGKVQEYTIVLN